MKKMTKGVARGETPDHSHPYVNGVAGTPIVKDLWLDSARRTWPTDV